MKKNLYDIFDRKSFNDAVNVSAEQESIPPYLAFLPHLPENDPLVYQYDINTLWSIRQQYYFSQYGFMELLRKNYTILLNLFFHQPDFFIKQLVPFLDKINTDIMKEIIVDWMTAHEENFTHHNRYNTSGEIRLVQYLKGNEETTITPKHMEYIQQWHQKKAFDTSFLRALINNPTIYSPNLLSFVQWNELHPQFNVEQMKAVMPFYFKEHDIRYITKHNEQYLSLLKNQDDEVKHEYLQYFTKKCLRYYTNSPKINVDSDILDIPEEYYPYMCNVLHRSLNGKKYFEIDNILPLLMAEPGHTLLRTHIFIHHKNNDNIRYLSKTDNLHTLDDVTFSCLLTILDDGTIHRYNGWNRVPNEILQLAQSGIISPSEIPDMWKTQIRTQYNYIFEQPELFIGSILITEESDIHL